MLKIGFFIFLGIGRHAQAQLMTHTPNACASSLRKASFDLGLKPTNHLLFPGIQFSSVDVTPFHLKKKKEKKKGGGIAEKKRNGRALLGRIAKIYIKVMSATFALLHPPASPLPPFLSFSRVSHFHSPPPLSTAGEFSYQHF